MGKARVSARNQAKAQRRQEREREKRGDRPRPHGATVGPVPRFLTGLGTCKWAM